MIKIKTDKELTIEFRNLIAARIIENKANLAYFEKIKDGKKTKSKEWKQANEFCVLNESRINKDIIFVSCIDEILNKYK